MRHRMANTSSRHQAGPRPAAYQSPRGNFKQIQGPAGVGSAKLP
jgi:hypothetical protein